MLCGGQKMLFLPLFVVHLIGYEHHAIFAENQFQLSVQPRNPARISHLVNSLQRYNRVKRAGKRLPPVFIQKTPLVKMNAICETREASATERKHMRREVEEMIRRDIAMSEKVLG